jgi:hypothetical protein
MGVMGGLAGVAGGLRGFSATLGVQVASGVWVTSGMPIVGGGGGHRCPWGAAGGLGVLLVAMGGRRWPRGAQFLRCQSP